jgi:hypothetical protein
MTTSALRAKPRTPRRIAFSQKLSRWDVKISPYLYVSPFFIVFAVVGLFPLLYTAWVSLHKWDLIAGQGPFVGLDNFTFVLGQDQFWEALRNTLSIFLLSSRADHRRRARQQPSRLNVLAHERPAAVHHHARGGRPHLRPTLRRQVWAH